MKLHLALMALMIMTFANTITAQSLLISPTRILFEGKTRAAEITLVNNGQDTQEYRISLLHLQQFADGSLKELEQGTELDNTSWADKYLRFSPRSVILQPKEVQIIRVQLRLSADTPTGEMRTAMLFRAVPPIDSIDKPDTKGVSVKISVIPGFSIPIVVRHNSKPSISSIECVKDVPDMLTCKIGKDGLDSLYSDLIVKSGSVVVGLIKGISVFIPFRTIKVPLVFPPKALPQGNFEVVLSDNPKGTILAKTTVIQ
jgi:P pilus assembly chaperone PapD